MENQDSYLSFLHIWHSAMWYLFLIAAGVSVLILLIYWIRYSSAGSPKEKHDIASEHEIKSFLQANYVLAVGIFFFLSTVYDETVVLSPIWFFIRTFVSLCIGTLHIYIAYLVFKYYYPGPLNTRLKRLRHTPRINPSTGNVMKLLSEDEEDAYLDEGMQAEEDAFSVDYDVWIDESTGETRIEKYKGHLSALECDRCGFQTLKLEKETIIRQPTETEDGEIEKEYLCTYCGRIKRKSQNLTKNVDRSVKRVTLADHYHTHVETVKVEIHSSSGETKVYEFQNTRLASKFLEEFDLEKLEQ